MNGLMNGLGTQMAPRYNQPLAPKPLRDRLVERRAWLMDQVADIDKMASLLDQSPDFEQILDLLGKVQC